MKFRNLQSLLVGQITFENLPSLGSNEFLADGPDSHLGSKVVSGFLTLTRDSVFRYVGKSKD